MLTSIILTAICYGFVTFNRYAPLQHHWNSPKQAKNPRTEGLSLKGTSIEQGGTGRRQHKSMKSVTVKGD